MNIKFWDKGTPSTPEEIGEAILGKAEREAAKIVAEAGRRKKLAEAGKQTMSAAIFLIRATSWGVLGAAAIISLAGYWYDALFYWQQSDNLAIQIGLLALALTLRTLSISIPVVLQWAKPQEAQRKTRFYFFQFWKNKPIDADADGDGEVTLQEFLAANRLARVTLRFIFVVSVIGCSFATLSFFASGPENRQAKVATIEASETVVTTNIGEQISGIEQQIKALRDDRDKAVATAQSSIDALAVDNTAANDGPEYTKQYTEQQTAAQEYARVEIAKLNAEIARLRSGKQTAEETKVDDLSSNQPFLGVYKFLGRLNSGWSEDSWTIAGVLFFTFAFEFIIAFLLGAAYALLMKTNSVIRWMTAKEAAHVMKWELKIARHEADTRLESLRAQAAREADEAAFNLAMTRQKAKEDEARREAEQEIAEVRRKAKEVQDRLDAIAAGEDPDAYDARKEQEREKRRLEADQRKAESERELAKIKAETERIRREAEDAAKPRPAMTPGQQRSENANMAKELLNETRDQRTKIPADDWSNRADRLEQAA